MGGELGRGGRVGVGGGPGESRGEPFGARRSWALGPMVGACGLSVQGGDVVVGGEQDLGVRPAVEESHDVAASFAGASDLRVV